MLIAHLRLLKTPVMSLQTGARLATTHRILIDPRDLTVVAYELDGSMLDEHPSYLRPVDVRELSNLGLIVDSSDEFVGLDDVIRIKEVASYGFELVGLDVIDERRRKVGKVQGYNLDSDSFSVQQLVVRRPLFKSFGETELLIHRSQIIDVHNDHITIKSTAEKTSNANGFVREYTNPFRTGSVQPESIDSEPRWP